MQFRTYGPIEITLDSHGRILNPLTDFWKDVERRRRGLKEGRGCYVFGIGTTGSQRITPWYVGMTHQGNFYKECFGAHQCKQYAYALAEYRRKKAFMYLVPQTTALGKLYRGRTGGSIDQLEQFLIGLAVLENDELCNKQGTGFWKDVVLPGFLNFQGNPGLAASWLRHTLNY